MRTNLHFKLITAIAAAAMMLTLAPAAFGSASAAQVYGGPGGRVIDVQPDEEPPTDAIPSEETVPEERAAQAGDDDALSFTGRNIGLILGAGILLVGVGIGTRRLVQTPQ